MGNAARGSDRRRPDRRPWRQEAGSRAAAYNSLTARGVQGAKTDGKTQNLYDELRKRLSPLRCESSEEGSYKSRGRSDHLLVDGIRSEGARNSTEETDRL